MEQEMHFIGVDKTGKFTNTVKYKNHHITLTELSDLEDKFYNVHLMIFNFDKIIRNEYCTTWLVAFLIAEDFIKTLR